MFENVEFDEDQQAYSDRLTSHAGELADEFNEVLPDSREKSLALTNLEQAIMWANRCLAVNDL